MSSHRKLCAKCTHFSHVDRMERVGDVFPKDDLPDNSIRREWDVGVRRAIFSKEIEPWVGSYKFTEWYRIYDFDDDAVRVAEKLLGGNILNNKFKVVVRFYHLHDKKTLDRNIHRILYTVEQEFDGLSLDNMSFKSADRPRVLTPDGVYITSTWEESDILGIKIPFPDFKSFELDYDQYKEFKLPREDIAIDMRLGFARKSANSPKAVPEPSVSGPGDQGSGRFSEMDPPAPAAPVPKRSQRDMAKRTEELLEGYWPEIDNIVVEPKTVVYASDLGDPLSPKYPHIAWPSKDYRQDSLATAIKNALPSTTGAAAIPAVQLSNKNTLIRMGIQFTSEKTTINGLTLLLRIDHITEKKNLFGVGVQLSSVGVRMETPHALFKEYL